MKKGHWWVKNDDVRTRLAMNKQEKRYLCNLDKTKCIDLCTLTGVQRSMLSDKSYSPIK